MNLLNGTSWAVDGGQGQSTEPKSTQNKAQEQERSRGPRRSSTTWRRAAGESSLGMLSACGGGASDVLQLKRNRPPPSPTRPGKEKHKRGGAETAGQDLITDVITGEVLNLDLFRGNSDLPPLVDFLPQASAFGFKPTPAGLDASVETSRPSCFRKAYLFVHYSVLDVFSKSRRLYSRVPGFIFLSPAFACGFSSRCRHLFFACLVTVVTFKR